MGPENAEVEGAIAEYITDHGISVDVLHVNHHGADNASAADFLEAIHPRVAVLSAGNKNTHGHPSYAALIRLAEAGVEHIYQTELGNTKWHEIDGRIPSEVRRRQAVFQGDVTITSDGESFEVSTSRRYVLAD